MSFYTVTIYGPKTGEVFGRVVKYYPTAGPDIYTYSGVKPSKEELLSRLKWALLKSICAEDVGYRRCGIFEFTLDKWRLPGGWFGVIEQEVYICVYYIDATSGKVTQKCEKIFVKDEGYDRTFLPTFETSDYTYFINIFETGGEDYPHVIQFSRIAELRIWDEVIEKMSEYSPIWVGLVYKVHEVPAFWLWREGFVILWKAWWSRDEVVVIFPILVMTHKVTGLAFTLFEGGGAGLTRPVDKPLIVFPTFPLYIIPDQDIPPSKLTFYNPGRRPVELFIIWDRPAFRFGEWTYVTQYEICRGSDEVIECEIALLPSDFLKGVSREKIPDYIYIPIYVEVKFLDTNDSVRVFDAVLKILIDKSWTWVSRSELKQVDPEGVKVVFRSLSVIKNDGSKSVKILGAKIIDDTVKESADIIFDEPVEVKPGEEVNLVLESTYVGLKPGEEVIVTVSPIIQLEPSVNIAKHVITQRATVREKERPTEVKVVKVELEPSTQVITTSESAKFKVFVYTDREPNVLMTRDMDVYVDDVKISTEVVYLYPHRLRHENSLTISGLTPGTHSVHVVVNGVRSNVATVYVREEPGVPSVKDVLINREVVVEWEKDADLEIIIEFTDVLRKDVEYRVIVEPPCGSLKYTTWGTLTSGRSRYDVHVKIPWSYLKTWLTTCGSQFRDYVVDVKVFILGQVFTGSTTLKYIKPIKSIDVDVDKHVVQPGEVLRLFIKIRK